MTSRLKDLSIAKNATETSISFLVGPRCKLDGSVGSLRRRAPQIPIRTGPGDRHSFFAELGSAAPQERLRRARSSPALSGGNLPFLRNSYCKGLDRKLGRWGKSQPAHDTRNAKCSAVARNATSYCHGAWSVNISLRRSTIGTSLYARYVMRLTARKLVRLLSAISTDSTAMMVTGTTRTRFIVRGEKSSVARREVFPKLPPKRFGAQVVSLS